MNFLKKSFSFAKLTHFIWWKLQLCEIWHIHIVKSALFLIFQCAVVGFNFFHYNFRLNLLWFEFVDVFFPHYKYWNKKRMDEISMNMFIKFGFFFSKKMIIFSKSMMPSSLKLTGFFWLILDVCLNFCFSFPSKFNFCCLFLSQ